MENLINWYEFVMKAIIIIWLCSGIAGITMLICGTIYYGIKAFFNCL